MFQELEEADYGVRNRDKNKFKAQGIQQSLDVRYLTDRRFAFGSR